MVTDVQICQKALIQLGSQTIDSLSEDNDRARACNNLYEDVKKDMLSRYQWEFAERKKELANTTNDPVSEWDNEFQLPPDMLRGPHSVYPGEDTRDPIQAWDKVGDKLLTNHDTIYIDYTEEVAESEFPAYFTELMVMVMASKLAKPVTDSLEMQREYHQQAFGGPNDNYEGGLYGVAKRTDSFGEPNSYIEDSPLTDVRWGGSAGDRIF